MRKNGQRRRVSNKCLFPYWLFCLLLLGCCAPLHASSARSLRQQPADDKRDSGHALHLTAYALLEELSPLRPHNEREKTKDGNTLPPCTVAIPRPSLHNERREEMKEDSPGTSYSPLFGAQGVSPFFSPDHGRELSLAPRVYPFAYFTNAPSPKKKRRRRHNHPHKRLKKREPKRRHTMSHRPSPEKQDHVPQHGNNQVLTEKRYILLQEEDWQALRARLGEVTRAEKNFACFRIPRNKFENLQEQLQEILEHNKVRWVKAEQGGRNYDDLKEEYDLAMLYIKNIQPKCEELYRCLRRGNQCEEFLNKGTLCKECKKKKPSEVTLDIALLQELHSLLDVFISMIPVEAMEEEAKNHQEAPQIQLESDRSAESPQARAQTEEQITPEEKEAAEEEAEEEEEAVCWRRVAVTSTIIATCVCSAWYLCLYVFNQMCATKKEKATHHDQPIDRQTVQDMAKYQDDREHLIATCASKNTAIDAEGLHVDERTSRETPPQTSDKFVSAVKGPEQEEVPEPEVGTWDSAREGDTAPTVDKKDGSKKADHRKAMLILISILIIVLMVGVGIFLWKRKRD